MLLTFFVSHLPHWQNITLEGLFFIPGNKKRSCSGRVGPSSHAIFGQKLLNTQHCVGRCTHKSPTMKGTNPLKESSKKFTEAKLHLSQHHQLLHRYRWVPRTHLAGKPVLQGAHSPEDNSRFFRSLLECDHKIVV